MRRRVQNQGLFVGGGRTRRGTFPQASTLSSATTLVIMGKSPSTGRRHFNSVSACQGSFSYQDSEGTKEQPSWRQRGNATEQMQAHPVQKLMGAFRVLAYGQPADRTDEYVRLYSSTIDEATRKLVGYLVDRYQASYLGPLTDIELRKILKRNDTCGMPGCMGSLDCSHWLENISPPKTQWEKRERRHDKYARGKNQIRQPGEAPPLQVLRSGAKSVHEGHHRRTNQRAPHVPPPSRRPTVWYI